MGNEKNEINHSCPVKSMRFIANTLNDFDLHGI